jgi:RNA polymerase sigma-70 factor (TIGR02960 family)
VTVSIDDLESLRPAVTRYCYRLLGSANDVDDAVQESFIRAFGHAADYDPSRARLTTWVHRIATNVCLDMLRGTRRRALAIDLGPAATGTELGQPLSPEHFVEPMPGRRLFGVDDPADAVLERETVRLAFVAMLQRLAPRQRAVLVLRDVLEFSAQEVAEVLDSTTPAVNSALQRARAVMHASPVELSDLNDPTDVRQRDLLRRYVLAFENHDVAELMDLLREDVVASMPPFAWWLQGAELIAELMTSSDACAGDRLILTDVNGQPGFGQYRPDGDGKLVPFALIALGLRDGRIAGITTFLGDVNRFAEYGLPENL